MFRPRLETVEETADQIVLRERPLYFPRIVFWAISTAPLSFSVRAFLDRDLQRACFAAVIFAMFFACGALAAVESTISITRVSGVFRIRRNLWWWARENEYSADDILTVFEEQTIKGNRLRSGRTKNVMLFLEYAALDGRAAMLNRFLHTARKSGKQASARNPLVD